MFDIQVNAIKSMLTKEVNDRADEDFAIGSHGDHGGESRQRVDCINRIRPHTVTDTNFIMHFIITTAGFYS